MDMLRYAAAALSLIVPTYIFAQETPIQAAKAAGLYGIQPNLSEPLQSERQELGRRLAWEIYGVYVEEFDGKADVAARIDPLDVEQVYPNQQVSVVFSAFNLRTLPDIPGRVVTLGADVSVDEATGLGYYEAMAAPDLERLAALTDLKPVPGMPVEVFLKTDERTPLDYLTQPLTSYFKRAFREE